MNLESIRCKIYRDIFGVVSKNYDWIYMEDQWFCKQIKINI